LQDKSALLERTIKLDSTVRVRFAPSPTGGLHLGSARTALFNWLFARHNGGAFILRIEDTDVSRSDRRHEEAIVEDLRWLGLEWDEGPDVGGPFGPYRQSERLAAYRAAAARLLAAGAAYHCFCSVERLEELRSRQRAADEPPRYDRRCLALAPDEVERRLAAGEPAAVRLRVSEREVVVDDVHRGPVEFGGGAFGDFIIVRSDGVAGYNFAVVVDDRDMAITHVIRGDDHLTNTARQAAVFAALGAAPPVYAHHGMILAPGGGKLSKRHGATAVGEFRESGYLPDALVNYLALLSWSHGAGELLDRGQMIREFDLEELSPSAAVFDRAKLDWLQHEYVMALDPEEHRRRFAERLPAGTAPPAATALAAAFKPSLAAYGEAAALAAAVLERPVPSADVRRRAAAAATQLGRFRAVRADAGDWLDPEAARRLLGAYRAWGKECGLAARDLLMPLRLVLTGSEHGPELHYVLAALARDETLDRLDFALRGAAPSADAGSARPAAPPTTEGDRP
jgi:glutamyl-tRNA synthetase